MPRGTRRMKGMAMAADADIALIKTQERRLAFETFDEGVAWALGSAIRARAVRENLSLVCDITLWDRPLFYCAMPGTTGENIDWVRRKSWLVKRLGKSSYRAMLENNGERVYAPDRGLDVGDYALAGGGFPLRIASFGVVGAVTISGLHERLDHGVAVAAICDHLGLDAQALALPPE